MIVKEYKWTCPICNGKNLDTRIRFVICEHCGQPFKELPTYPQNNYENNPKETK